jgi:hypothetical protein
MGPSMAPIRLTDSQLDAVLAAARPLAAGNRDAFLQAIVDALEGVVDPGDGDIHRAIMTAQRRFWDPPLMDHLAQHRGPLVVTLESPIRRAIWRIPQFGAYEMRPYAPACLHRDRRDHEVEFASSGPLKPREAWA